MVIELLIKNQLLITMDYQAQLNKQILILTSSHSIDEKRGVGTLVLELFKEASTSAKIPVAVKLNRMLSLREAIDNFITHDNAGSREALKSNFQSIRNLIYSEEVA